MTLYEREEASTDLYNKHFDQLFGQYELQNRFFNSDGKLDLAVANGGPNNLSVLLNRGSGTFAQAVNFTAGTSASAVWAGVPLTKADASGEKHSPPHE